jgi:ELWxxDGT repeat protein
LPLVPRRTVLLGCALVAAASRIALAQPATLVKDIAPGFAPAPGYSIHGPFVRSGGLVYTMLSANSQPPRLWRTDGTAAGTQVVAAVPLSPIEYTELAMIDVGGTLFFSTGPDLWKTDGSAAGTVQVSAGASPHELAHIGNTVYFSSSSGIWRTDGTPGSASLVTSTVGRHLTAAGSRVFFVVTNGNFLELWATDGTPGGTGPLAQFDTTFFFGFDLGWLTPVGNRLFFQGYDAAHGIELWTSDGTPAGTHIVADIAPGTDSSSPTQLVAFNGSLLFSATDGVSGQELWKSDGAASGASLVLDIHPGSGYSYPAVFRVVGPLAYFVADDGTHGSELWSTDGTPGGTSIVADLAPGPTPSYASPAASVASTLFFTVTMPSGATALWTVTAPAAPVFVQNVYVTDAVALDDRIVFSDGNGELQVSDGSPGGTLPIEQFGVPPGTSPRLFTPAGGSVFFEAQDAIDGDQTWVTNGTPGGTSLVPLPASIYGVDQMWSVGPRVVAFRHGELWSLEPGNPPVRLVAGGYVTSLASSSDPPPVFQGAVYFLFNSELWKTDGTPGGTILVKTFTSGLPTGAPVDLAGTGYFFVDAQGSYELWKTDGTGPGTTLIDTVPGSAFRLTPFNGHLFFIANSQIWRTDGTPGGSAPVIPLSPTSMVVANGKLLFVASHPMTGDELWESDGTFAGTHLVKDIRPGLSGSAIVSLVPLGSAVYFAADDGVHGSELWKSDGTAVGTTLVADIYTGSTSSGISNFRVWNGTLFFTATTPSSGEELWKSDGTPGGTVMVLDIESGTDDSSPRELADGGTALYFSAFDSVHGREIWKSDGTPGGTMLVRDLDPGAASSSPNDLVEFRGNLTFGAWTADAGQEPWTSDGTAGGTNLFEDVRPGQGSSYPTSFFAAGARLFFTAFDGAHGGPGLYVSDGTAGGTTLLKAFPYPRFSSVPTPVIALGNNVVFLAEDRATGFEPWVTDGTPGGTHILQDIAPGAFSSNPGSFVRLGGIALFLATTSNHLGLFRTDGTSAGTVEIANVGASASAASTAFTGLDYSIVYSSAGVALWKSDGTPGGTSIVTTVPTAGIGAIVASGSRLFFVAGGLWASDGTSAGTVSIHPPFSVGPYNLVDVNGTLFFVADDDGSNGQELWKSDGTSAGTMLVRKISAGPDSNVSGLVNVGGTLVFQANDGIHGQELWKSDGSSAGTTLLQDIDPGLPSSQTIYYAPPPTIAGTRVYFAAREPATGTELWSMPMSAVCSPPAVPSITSTRNPSCGDTVTLDAGPGYASYLWSTGETTRMITVAPGVTTTYTAIGANATGCRASSTITQVVDTSGRPSAPSISNNGPICAGETLQLSAVAVPGATYVWTGPGGFTSPLQNPQILSASPAESGIYQLVVVVGGCSSPPSTTSVVVHPAPSATIAASSLVCAGSTGNPASVPSAGAGATYAWTIGNGTITSGAGTNAITYTAGASGSVSLDVTVTDANGCSLPGNRSVSIGATCGNDFFVVPPCRLVDTRSTDGPALAAGADRIFTLAGKCGIPVGAVAVSLNVAVTATGMAGNLILFPTGATPPPTSAINYRAGQTRSNDAIVAVDASGRITVRCNQVGGTTHLILDVNGYLAP